ncbi:hypothetical protein NBO_86g0002 [Nosema bombycis CQ1]|uniref:Uncharacterized protein n=1 Tax=Nosema bombycis (strain CQ1 / CVCC 102059) TaxID=578461 RepID=R0KSS0_NOSB1|nr:hypothetical protein NBO_86g0002 [Nosema bombycis CQ1]|eukprot:EOB13267.1 hypothetical protein NBO_86g0002 [Nosema bombycis CQ1]
MEKKIDEIINNTKNETVHDLLTLFNSKIVEKRESRPYKWNYNLESYDIIQPDTVPSSTFPLIISDKDYLLLTFNGKSIFYNQDLSKFYISVPTITKNMCIYRTENKTYLITLDQSNKLHQSEIKDGVVQQEKFIISRNVLQLVKYNEIVYFISYKKDIYNLNILITDENLIRPKIIIPQIQVKYSIEVFPTQFGIFLKKDMKIYQEDGKKFSMKGDGVTDIDKFIIIYKKTEEGILLSLLNQDMIIKYELIIPFKSQNVIIKSLGDVVILRAGDHLYFIQIFNNEMIIGFEYKYEKYPVSVDFKLQDNIIKIFNLYSNNKISSIKENYELKGNGVEEDLPQPSEKSRNYDPILSNSKNQDLDLIIVRLFKKFEEKIEERELNENKG